MLLFRTLCTVTKPRASNPVIQYDAYPTVEGTSTMPTKGDNEPLHKVIGSTGHKNQAIKGYLAKIFGFRKRPSNER